MNQGNYKYLIKMQNQNSVIILGAGLSGLTAADQILKADPTTKITILQAMAGPGGRTRSIKLNGTKYDLGAQWVGPPQIYTQQLGRRARNQLMFQNNIGKKITQIQGKAYSYQDNLPSNLEKSQCQQLDYIVKRIQDMALTVPKDHPRNCPNALLWDSITVHTWGKLNIKSKKVLKFFQMLVRSNYGCENNQVSFLFFLYYIRQNHGFQTMMNTQNGLQAYKFVKGTQPLSQFLEKQIKAKGGQIHYNSFVNNVIQNDKEVIVSTRNGVSFKAKLMIIAAAPQAIKHIFFEPQLSRQRRFIADRYTMAAFSKMVLLYDKRYWYQKGFSGQILTDCAQSPVLNAFDQTKPNQKGQLQPAIIVLFAAAVQEKWGKDKQALKKATIQKLAQLYESPQMLKPLKVQFKIWNQQESVGGAPTAYTPPGVLSKVDNIRKPQGRIHWAGTQTALVSQGYMDGAIQSGYRVSKQIIQRFKKGQQSYSQEKKPFNPNVKNYTQLHTNSQSIKSRL